MKKLRIDFDPYNRDKLREVLDEQLTQGFKLEKAHPLLRYLTFMPIESNEVISYKIAIQQTYDSDFTEPWIGCGTVGSWEIFRFDGDGEKPVPKLSEQNMSEEQVFRKERRGVPIVWLVLHLLVLAFSVYVVVSKTVTKLEQKAQFEQASANAVRYVRDKYGFDAEVVGTDGKYAWSYDDEIGNMSLKMKYGDKEFNVYTSRTEESSEGCDDYQWDEIKAAAESYVNEALPGGKIVYLSLSESTYFYFLIYTYFDGNNIEQILSNCSGRIEMVFADTDFSESDMPQKLYDLGIVPKFTSFDTQEHMDEFLNRVENNHNVFYYEDYQVYAPHITDYISIDDGKTERLDIHFLQTDDFEYCYFPVRWNSFSESSDKVKAEPSNKGKLGEIFGKYGEEYALAKPLSKEYYFDGIYGDFWIFIPLEKLSGYDLEKLGVAWFSAGGMSNNRDISRAEICGDYAVFNLPFGEDSFMLVDNSGQEEYVPAWKDQRLVVLF